ncbi:MAG: hypothetical protein IKW74_04175, partial [Thermoguttaceae bacterium]|nr:hypothetical protein [Thermoguttaceae bacterium]
GTVLLNYYGSFRNTIGKGDNLTNYKELVAAGNIIGTRENPVTAASSAANDVIFAENSWTDSEVANVYIPVSERASVFSGYKDDEELDDMDNDYFQEELDDDLLNVLL